ncbi:MAG: hypothetical protein BM485_14065 [Desulfobulbaceae bacterium DB1]|nr:MAG: hypothetical protein BM485_14065 [Desulfobulbaceae bacterium DB1]
MQKTRLPRTLLLFFLFCFLMPFFSGACRAEAQTDEEKKLILLNWSDYIDPEILAEFKKRTGITVSEVYYETDEMRNEMLVNADGKGYDLVLSNGSSIASFVARGWLVPINEKEIDNLRFIDRRWREAFPEAEKYGVPYLWGTLGIGYRSDRLAEPVTSWMDLFRPDPALKNKILMIKDSRDLVGMALKALGHSANSIDPGQLDQAGELLLAQKPFVKSYSLYSLTEDSALVQGEALISMMYNGDALALREFNPAIRFVLPREGGNLWCDYFVLLRSSTKGQWARQFLNFIHEPTVMARLARFAYFATTNKEAEKLLPKEFLTDPVIYPSRESLLKSESYAQLPPRVTKKVNTIFNDVIH